MAAEQPRRPIATFVAYLAQRYGTRLAAIEVWNEPDQSNEAYFAGPEKPQRYAAVLRAAYPAIKQANPNVPVLAGSLVGANGVFLRALYAAGIKGYYDGLAVHYYTLTLASLRSIHEVQVANGDTKPLWLNEFGWSSCWPQSQDPAGTGLRHRADPGSQPDEHVPLARAHPLGRRRGRLQAAGHRRRRIRRPDHEAASASPRSPRSPRSSPRRSAPSAPSR